MDNSKINQSELKYGCGAGGASLNLCTGRLLYEHPDISIGTGNFYIGISHIFNSRFDEKTDLKISETDFIKTGIGNGWKLNIQQYLFPYDSSIHSYPGFANGDYVYIDAAGCRHRFIHLDAYDYYDTTGLGLIMTADADECMIFDQLGNKMYFSGNRLVGTESCHNSNIKKQYVYTDNELTIKDVRSINELILKFDKTSGLLKTITSNRNGESKQINYYYYDLDKNLVRVEEEINDEIKNVALFKYDEKKMAYAVDMESKAALKFEYEPAMHEGNFRVNKVNTGVVNIESQHILFCGQDIICENDTLCGETNRKTTRYVIDSGVQTLGSDLIRQNSIHYDSSATVVVNENAVKMMYCFNSKGFTASILEAHNGDENDLRALEIIPGKLMMSAGSDLEKINQQSAHLCNTGKKITTLSGDILSDNLNEIASYRKKKCPDYVFYNCSFWLKLLSRDINPEITLSVCSKSGINSETTNKGRAFIDSSAINSWQFVTIPIRISRNEIKEVELAFTETSTEKSFKIADMRLCYSPLTNYCIKEGSRNGLISDATQIIYSTDATIGKDISADCYMSESDLQTTFINMYKSRGTAATGNYVLSLCDCTKKALVSETKIRINNEYYLLAIGSDGLANFSFQTRSPDNEMLTYNEICFGEYTVGDNTFSGIRQVVRAEYGGKSSSLSSYMDFKGKVIREEDEYGVTAIYEYDDNGNAKKKIISHADTLETLTYKTTTSEASIIDETPTSYTKTYYNQPSGSINKIEYGGAGASGYALTTIDLEYDDFGQKLTAVDNAIAFANGAGKNKFAYDSRGRISEVSLFNISTQKSMYGFKTNYNNLNNPTDYYYFAYDSDGNKIEKLLTKKTISYTDDSITAKQYRSVDNPDTITVNFDQYGRTNKIVEIVNDEEKVTTVIRQDETVRNENDCAREIVSKYDPFENRTYEYKYDNFNNCTGYQIKDNGNNDANFLSIEKSGQNQVLYKFDTPSEMITHKSEIEYIDDKLLSPQLKQTHDVSGLVYNNELIEHYRCLSRYGYDSLGRLDYKWQLSQGADISTSISYKYWTNLRSTIAIDVDRIINDNKDISYRFEHSYDSLGQILSNTYKKTYGDETTTKVQKFRYDKGNRITTEENSDGERVYYYNNDGSIFFEMQKGIREDYIYDKGRLIEHKKNNAGTIESIKFSYDNLGNCTHYKSSSANMEWERGSLLRKYTTAGASGNAAAEYSYNSQGIRFRKTISGGKTTRYYLDGEKLVGEYNGGYIRYMYDAEGITGFCVGKYDDIYRYIKDASDNVIAILYKNNEVATYEYDAWGKCTVLNPDGTKNTSADFIGNSNPIRWKSQYYDQESDLYYINGRYYSPEIRRYLSPASPESMMGNAAIIYGLNPYLLTVANPVNMGYNGYTIETSMPLAYDPDELSKWDLFWGNYGGWITSGLQIAAGIGLCFIPGAQGLGAGLIIGGSVGMIGNAVGSHIGGGVGSMINGGGAIGTGIGLLGFGPVGWIAGGALIAVGAGTVALGANEVAYGITGTNYIQSWTGMSDSWYNGLYIGLNAGSAVGQIAGNMYMNYADIQINANRTPGDGKPFSRVTATSDSGFKQQAFYNSKGKLWYQKDISHGGVGHIFPHYHGFTNGKRVAGTNWSFWKLLGWLLGG